MKTFVLIKKAYSAAIKPPTHSAVLAAMLTLLPVAAGEAQQPRKRQPLSLGLFLRPYKPQTVTPQIFGLLPDNKYLQEEIKLTAAQKKRMREIEFQLTRVSTVLLDKEIGRELAVSEGQRDRIRKLLAEGRAKSEKAYREFQAKRKKNRPQAKKPPAPRKARGKQPALPKPPWSASKELVAIRKQHEEIESACDKACLEVLTRTQQARFHRLTGKPFDATKVFNRRNLKAPGLEVAVRKHPYTPQTTTPRVFGVASYNEYVQSDLQVTREQKSRMRQIEIQLTRGSRAFLEPDVAKELSLSKKQISQIHTMRTQYLDEFSRRNERRHARALKLKKEYESAHRKGDARAAQKVLDQVYAEIRGSQPWRRAFDEKYERKFFDLLTQAQQRRFQSFQGKPVDPEKIFHPQSAGKKSNSLRSDI